VPQHHPHPPKINNIRRKNKNPTRSEPIEPRSATTTYRHGEEAQRSTVAREYRKHHGNTSDDIETEAPPPSVTRTKDHEGRT
jgi:hypothetical protein